MLERRKSRGFSVEWVSRSFQPRVALSPVVKQRNKMSAASCWPTFGKELVMSRIGKKTILIPEKVKLNVSNEGALQVEGPKGKLSWTLPKQITCKVEGSNV